jgi:C_GCAxxG_C_C family probable redox protein
MRALLEIRGEALDMISPTAGLPGGIGGSGAECGGVTSPIMVLGMTYGAVPTTIAAAQEYMRRFRNQHGGVNCSEIYADGSSIRPCIGVITKSPALLMDVIEMNAVAAIDAETADAYNKLLTAFHNGQFHCTHSVLYELGNSIGVNETLLRASWGFVGGTALQGLTCGALTAGVIAIGLKRAVCEERFFRCVNLFARMAVGADTSGDDLNNFQPVISAGGELARWFKAEYGSTRCADILQTDFALVVSRRSDCLSYE